MLLLLQPLTEAEALQRFDVFQAVRPRPDPGKIRLGNTAAQESLDLLTKGIFSDTNLLGNFFLFRVPFFFLS